MGILSRIKRWHLVAVGGVITAAMLVAFIATFLLPTTRQMKELRDGQSEQEQTWQRLPTAVNALSDAQQRLRESKADTEKLLATMPKISSDPFQAMFDLHEVFNDKIGPPVYDFFLSLGYVASGISVPASPMQPVIVPPLMSFNWSLNPQMKSLPATINFLRRLKGMPYPGVISSISVSGMSPQLSVPMPLTVYVVTQRALVLGAPAPAGAPAAAPTMAAPPSERRGGGRGAE
ncbi:MAG TPA: hypothetical protein VM221_10415 [Armatimonadota bacterium]|nr:hypothetical protein [Armatimonadota bacterium]